MELQINYISGLAYQGRNQAELQTAKEQNKFESNYWLTFLQAKEKGLKIKKGSKGVSVFKGFQEFTNKNKDGKIQTISAPVGFARVFNLDQTEDLNQLEQERQDEIQEDTTSMEEKLEQLNENNS